MARRKKENDNDNNINNDSIINDDIDFYFIEFCHNHNIKDIYKIAPTQFTAALIYICHKYILPNQILISNSLPGYKYNIFVVNALVDRYIYMTYIYNQPISLLAFSHLSGINYDYIVRWQYEKNSVSIDINTYKSIVGNISDTNIYNISGLSVDGKMVSISYYSIYEKIINNRIYNADILALYKSGVNSIAYANRVHEKHDKTRNNNQPVFDMLTAADSLGISDKIQALETTKKQ